MKYYHLSVFKLRILVLIALSASVPAIASDISSLVEERNLLNSTTWKQEIDAQDHEEAFIRLWDNLRASSDALDVFRNFEFGSIKLGELEDWKSLEHAIFATELKAASKRFSREEWIEWMETMSRNGFSLTQSEWHHKRFDRLPNGQSRSVVSATLHVENEKSNTRYILDGKLSVEWRPQRNAGGYYSPETIEVIEMEILYRSGPPLFRRLGVIDIAPKRRGPVLMYDLNQDGGSEIILPAANQIAWHDAQRGPQLKPFATARIQSVRTAVAGDFNGDGYPDLMVDGTIAVKPSGPAKVGLYLFRGLSGGSLDPAPQEVTVDPALSIKSDTTLTAGDIDRDGDLDLWLGHYKEPYVGGSMPTPFYDANDGHPSFLLVNEGDGLHFTEEAAARGLKEKLHRRVFSSSFVDYDNDLDLDLLVVSDFSGVDLYRNRGDGYFDDVTSNAIEYRSSFGMGHSFGDFNRDGFMDMYVIGMSSTTASRLHQMDAKPTGFQDLTNMRIPMTYGNRLYYSQGDGSFSQPKENDEIARTGWSWGVVTVDFDNDGDLDFYVANGHDSNTTSRDYCTSYWTDDIYRGSSKENPLFDQYFSDKLGIKEEQGISWNGFEHNFLSFPMSDGRIRNIGFLAGMALEQDSRMVAVDDLNGDGRLDLLVDFNKPDWNEAIEGNSLGVYINQIPNTGNWIGIKMREGPGQRDPTGARVTVVAGGRVESNAFVNGDSYETQRANARTFGLGEIETVDFVEITWMDGTVRRLENPATNRYHWIDSK